MFFGILLLLIGFFLLLNALGLLSGDFWGFFWAIILIAIGIKMIVRKGHYGFCKSCMKGKMYEKIHDKMDGHCCHEHQADEKSSDQN